MGETIQILELFGGIGSPRCALRNLNIPTKAIDYVEINEKAVRSYNSMFREELAYKTQTVVGWNLKPDMRTCESHIEPPRGGSKHQFHRMQRVKSTSNVQRQRNRNSQSNNRRLNRWQQDSA